MPIIDTLKQIFALCWRDRAVALRFGLIPLAINLGLVVAFAEAMEPTFASFAIEAVIGLVSILAFAPFCIAWYRMVLFGNAAIDMRSLFTVSRREFRFFGWTLAISAMVGAVSVIALFVGGGIVVAISALNATAGIILGFALALGWIATAVMALSRWSVGLAMVAVNEPVSLRTSWDAAKPYGWSMAVIQVLIFAGVGVLAGVCLAAVLPDLADAARADTDPPATAMLALNIVTTLCGAISLWLSSTLFALVYRRIMADKAQTETPALPDPQSGLATVDQEL